MNEQGTATAEPGDSLSFQDGLFHVNLLLASIATPIRVALHGVRTIDEALTVLDHLRIHERGLVRASG